MNKIIGLALLSFLLMGCAKTMFYKSDFSQAQYERDLYACQKEAEERLANTAPSSRENPFNFMIKNPYIKECMQNRFGYTVGKE